MKGLFITFLITINTLGIPSSYAARGNSSGGGGDASEVRVDEIRSDILKWIKNEGAKGLKFPANLSIGEYTDRMKEILQEKKVVIEFTNEKVKVNKVEKTCQGFLSLNKMPQIRCNITRFKETKDSEQYILIHHEYAGLAGVEGNEGAASDYIISSQLTGYLEQQLVLKLVVKNEVPVALDVEKVREGMKFKLENLSTVECTGTGEGPKYAPFNYFTELDKMTTVTKVYWDLPRDSYFAYTFSYINSNDVKFEEKITLTDERELSSLSLNILKKQKINVGTIDNPKFVLDYVSIGELNCPIKK